jgi:hypothetical protein
MSQTYLKLLYHPKSRSAKNFLLVNRVELWALLKMGRRGTAPVLVLQHFLLVNQVGLP